MKQWPIIFFSLRKKLSDPIC